MWREAYRSLRAHLPQTELHDALYHLHLPLEDFRLIATVEPEDLSCTRGIFPITSTSPP